MKFTSYTFIDSIVGYVLGLRMQCSNSSSNSSGGGILERKSSYIGHPSLPSSLGTLGLTNIGLNLPIVSSNSHTSTPPASMYYDQIKYTMWNYKLSLQIFTQCTFKRRITWDIRQKLKKIQTPQLKPKKKPNLDQKM